MKAKNVNTLSAFWAALICVMMGLAACQDYSIDSQPEGAPKVLCDALEQYNVQATDPDNIVFSVSANTPWKITVSTDDEDKSWCVPTPGISSAAGLVSEVTVAIANNENYTPREATLTITGDDVDQKIVVKVVQAALGNLRVLSGTALSEKFDVNSAIAKTLTIRSNKAWEIVCKDMWVHFDPISGESSDEDITINVTVDANEGLGREATFIVKTALEETEEYVISQNGATLEVAEEELVILTSLPANSNEMIEVPVSATMEWTVETEESWVKDLLREGDKMKFVCEPNYKFTSRSGFITLKATSGDMTYSVPVTQSGATFHCWGKGDKQDVTLPDGRISDKGILLKGNDAFRIAFPGDFRRGTLTWEFEEMSLSSPLVLAGANDYDVSKVPNTHIVFCDPKQAVNGANDWRVNGNGWWVTWQNVSTLRNGFADIKKVQMVFDVNGVKLSLYGKDDALLDEKSQTINTSDATWNGTSFSYSLYFQNIASESEYCILKSFKAEPIE